MATTKKTTAKKTAAKKTTAKKTTAAAKTATTRPASSGPAAKTDAVRATIASAAKEADETFKQYTAVAGEQLAELRQLVRDAVDIYVGVPYVLGMRFADSATAPSVDLEALKSFVEDVKTRLAEVPSVDFDAVKAFVDEAKTVGHARVSAFETQVTKRLRNLYAA